MRILFDYFSQVPFQFVVIVVVSGVVVEDEGVLVAEVVFAQQGLRVLHLA